MIKYWQTVTILLSIFCVCGPSVNAQFGGTTHYTPSPLPASFPLLKASINISDPIPQNNPSLNYPAGASMSDLSLWKISQERAINELWNTSQARVEEMRKQKPRPASHRAVEQWLTQLRIATQRWFREVGDVYQTLVQSASSSGDQRVPQFAASAFGPGGRPWPGPIPSPTTSGVGPIPIPGPGPMMQARPGNIPSNGANQSTNNKIRQDKNSGPMVPIGTGWGKQADRYCTMNGIVTYWFGNTTEKQHKLARDFDNYLQTIECPPPLPDKALADWSENVTYFYLQSKGIGCRQNRYPNLTTPEIGKHRRSSIPDLEIFRDPDPALNTMAFGEVKITSGDAFPAIPESLTEENQQIIYPLTVTPGSEVWVVDSTKYNWQPRNGVAPPIPIVFYKIKYKRGI